MQDLLPYPLTLTLTLKFTRTLNLSLETLLLLILLGRLVTLAFALGALFLESADGRACLAGGELAGWGGGGGVFLGFLVRWVGGVMGWDGMGWVGLG